MRVRGCVIVLRLLRAVSPVRVFFTPPKKSYLDVQVFVFRWACRITDPRMGGTFGNGSRLWSGWHNWRNEAGAEGPCYDFCACRICWRGWTGIPFSVRLRWRLHHLWYSEVLRGAI